MIIRAEMSSDLAAIRAAEEAAFARPDEAGLVDALRSAGDAVFSLVAVDGGRVVGHVMFSKMSAPFRALGLGPVAVLPERQRTGIGSQLIREGLARAVAEDWKGGFVLGDPAYYGRFGFDADKASGFRSPYSEPYLMALALGADDLPTRSGSIEFAPAFSVFG
jgi:putative acetyltransferase